MFHTEAQRPASREAVMTVTCTAAVEGESPTNNDDSPSAGKEVPEDVREILMTPNSHAASVEVQLDSEQTMESEVQLMSQLDEALKALKS